MNRFHSKRRSLIEMLEPRTLLSAAAPNVNISKMTGNQAEGAIAVDRAFPSHLFAVSNLDATAGDGVLVATSADNGATWSHRVIATGADGLPAACCDPSAAFDTFGNLFLAYLNSTDNQVEVLLSTDAGKSFSLIKQFNGPVDQPTVVTGPGSVWLTFDRYNGVAATGASDTGLNAIGTFLPLRQIRGSTGGDFGDIAIGPSGQVLVTYQKSGSKVRSRIYTSLNAGGLQHPSFDKPVLVANTNVGDFDFIPAQPVRGIDSEAGLAFDRSGGAFTGRIYLAYTDELPVSTNNTDIFLRYSDNQGTTWSDPMRMNDDTGSNSQLLPRIALDNTTGQVGVSWFDARNDLGAGGTGDVDMIADNDVEFFGTVVTPQIDGLSVSPNQQISAGATSAVDAASSIDLGDYTGLDFYGGTLHPLWFDNSNTTGDNPNGKHKALNAYTAAVPSSAFRGTSRLLLGGLAEPAGPVPSISFLDGNSHGVASSGAPLAVTVTYGTFAGINFSTLGNSNLLITGPNGFSAPARLLHARTASHGRAVIVRYSIPGPGGRWRASDDGTYTISLQPQQVADSAGKFTTGGILGTFAVAL
jgi:hypothetical protein